ncbi:TVP38/TMEM64 family protein [Acidobacteriota bacterium]
MKKRCPEWALSFVVVSAEKSMTKNKKRPLHSSKSPQAKKSLLKPILLVVVLAVVMILARVFDLGGRLGELREWILSLGTLGPLVFVVIYTAAVVLAIPGSVITIMAGILFGSVLGVVTVSVASTLGACLAFLISRHMVREAVAQRLSENRKFHRLDQLTKEHGAIIVAITRLVPIFPFNLLNYGFGLTQVSFRTYALWSWVCMLPGTVLYVVGSDAVASAIAQGKVPWLLVGILLLTGLIITILVRQARKKLKTKERDPANE